MDVSLEYVKMCDCEEIQELCQGQTGDVVYLTKDLKGYNGWRNYCKGRIEIVGNDGEYDITISDRGITAYGVLQEDGLVWLPRQDQLQEMINKTNWAKRLVALYDFAFEYASGACAECFNNIAFADGEKFYEDCIDKILKQWGSLEQLWLAFVMKEKYQKTWNEGRWIKKAQYQRQRRTLSRS